MTKLAFDRMTGMQARADVASCRAVVKQLNRTGFSLTAPKYHLVFADYLITACPEGMRGVSSYGIDGWSIGLPNSRHPTAFLPPYAFVCLDEAQKYYDSRRGPSERLPDFVSRFYETHRHNYYNVVMTCQRPKLIDLNIRGIAERFIFIEELRHAYDKYGNLTRTVWECVEFNNTASAEAYSESKTASGDGIKTQYVHCGNIFSCYNSFGFFALHYRDRYDQDFSLFRGSGTGWSMSQIQDFNEVHDYEIPDTFFNSRSKRS
jgi:hypothetical protein